MKIVKVLIGLCFFSAVIGLLWAVIKGVDPKPDRVLNPTYFEDEAHLGRALARRFYVDIQQTSLLILGGSPYLKNYEKIWHEFLRTLIADGISIDRVYSINGLRPLTGKDVFINSLDQVELQGRVVVFVPSDENWFAKIRQKFPTAQRLLFQVPYQILPENLEKLLFQQTVTCDPASKILNLTCKAREASKAYFRNKLTEDHFAAMMEVFDANLYLLFVSEPQ